MGSYLNNTTTNTTILFHILLINLINTMVDAEYNRGSSSNNANAMRVSSTTAIVDTSIESIINHRCRSIFRATKTDQGDGSAISQQEPASSSSSRCSGGGILQCLSSFTLRPIDGESSMDVEELVSDSSDDEHHRSPMHRQQQQQQSFQSIFRHPICGTKRGFEDDCDDEDDDYLHCNGPSNKKRRCIAPSICRSNPIGSTSSTDDCGYEDTPPPLSTILTSSSSVSPLAWSSSPYTSLFVEAETVPVTNDDTSSLNHPLSFQSVHRIFDCGGSVNSNLLDKA